MKHLTTIANYFKTPSDHVRLSAKARKIFSDRKDARAISNAIADSNGAETVLCGRFTIKRFSLLTTIAVLFVCLSVKGQINFSTKTFYKYSKEDGWVRIVESEWFTINNGDTTFWTNKKEDTQQEDPGIKADSVPVLIPSSVFSIGTPEPIRITPIILTVSKVDTVALPTATSIITNTVIVDKVKYKDRTKVKYKTKWRTKKNKVVKPKVIRKPPPPPPINVITYKKKLWCVLSNSGSVFIVEANTKKGAIKKLGIPCLSATNFSDYSIVR